MGDAGPPLDISKIARPNILTLQPYRCARDDYKDDGTNTLLDANENAYGPGLDLDGPEAAGPADGGLPHALLRGLHRYPDPHLEGLKQQLCDLRSPPPPPSAADSALPDGDAAAAAPSLTPAHVVLGVGSDEIIDGLLRAFCAPGRDRILTCPPTYGMYDVSARVNDVAVVRVPLQLPDFDVDVAAVATALSRDPSVKLVYLCSPGNPTGARIPLAVVRALLAHPTWPGLVVLDEAYVDFAADPAGGETASLAAQVPAHPRLVVMQTLSKAYGLAGARLGLAFCDPRVARLLNALKAPYNVGAPTAWLAARALAPAGLRTARAKVARLRAQRERLVAALPAVPGVGARRGGLDANFVLVEILDRPRAEGGRPSNAVARRVYERLAGERGVVVRFRGSEYGCEGCLRMTVGTEEEVTKLLTQLREVLAEVFAEQKQDGKGDLTASEEKSKAAVANNVVT